MKFHILAVLALTSLALSSCNTMIGLGRDTRLLGEGMEKTAERSTGAGYGGGVNAPVY